MKKQILSAPLYRSFSSKLKQIHISHLSVIFVMCRVKIQPPCPPSPVYLIAIRSTGDQCMTSLGVGLVPCTPDTGGVQ